MPLSIRNHSPSYINTPDVYLDVLLYCQSILFTDDSELATHRVALITNLYARRRVAPINLSNMSSYVFVSRPCDFMRNTHV